jgi:hypothetical protein
MVAGVWVWGASPLVSRPAVLRKSGPGVHSFWIVIDETRLALGGRRGRLAMGHGSIWIGTVGSRWLWSVDVD